MDDDATQPVARLVVRSGSANIAELLLSKPRTHIGREINVYRNQGLHRRNDLAFIEEKISIYEEKCHG